MKDHRERTARLQLIEYLFAGQRWQAAVAQSQLKVSRSTAYRLVQLGRSEEKAERAFLDDRHGHPSKLTEPIQVWMTEFCTTNLASWLRAASSVNSKAALESKSASERLNRVRAQCGVSHQWQGRAQAQGEKN